MKQYLWLCMHVFVLINFSGCQHVAVAGRVTVLHAGNWSAFEMSLRAFCEVLADCFLDPLGGSFKPASLSLPPVW